MARPIHPLVQVAIHALVEGPSGVALRPGGLEAVSRALAEYFDRPELPAAVRALMAFALYVGEGLEDRAVALALLGCAAEATAALERQALTRDERAREAKKVAAALATGHEALKVAPRLGDAPREGSVSLASILSGLPGRRRG